MIENVKKLTVKYNGRTVGILSLLEDKIAFQYDEGWVKNGFPISPISLPLSREIYINRKDNFGGLYAVFHDSLPDGWGELLVSRMLAKKGINYETLNPLTKLSIIGDNGLGGLSYEPSQADREQFGYDLDELAKQAANVLDDGDAASNFDEIYYMGGSSGGARPKAHIKCDDGEWIVKFPCRIDPPDIGEREYRANLLAKDCEINVNECRLFPSTICSGYFGAKRFDRSEGRRVHMVSLSSVLETTHRISNLDYMHLFQVISIIGCDKKDLYEAYRRMCFNVLYGNKDDHGKNFAFLYNEKEGRYRLSPAYDLTKTPNKPEHEMTVLGNGKPTQADLIAIAKELRLSPKRYQEILLKTESVLLK